MEQSTPNETYSIDDEYELSSSPSIHSDDDIDSDCVYALHTFVATVEGQASAAKGDSLVLLDDSNSYWWLVKIAKDQSIGYLPAEHIETPPERLARLNKHRNVDLAASMLQDHLQRPRSRKQLFRQKTTKAVTIADQVAVYQVDLDEDEDEDEDEEEEPPPSRPKTMSALLSDPETEIKLSLTPSIAQNPPPKHLARLPIDEKKKSSVFGTLFRKKKKLKKVDQETLTQHDHFEFTEKALSTFINDPSIHLLLSLTPNSPDILPEIIHIYSSSLNKLNALSAQLDSIIDTLY